MRRLGTPKEWFEEKFIKTDGCWNWTGGKSSDGYGSFGFDGGIQGAHRVSYRLYVGEIPKGMCVCHHCDNPSCVRPDHLFLGTIIDNVRDRDNKGRRDAPFGENNGRSKLTEEAVRIIKTKHANGARNIDLAKEFGVSNQTISAIVCGCNWKNV